MRIFVSFKYRPRGGKLQERGAWFSRGEKGQRLNPIQREAAKMRRMPKRFPTSNRLKILIFLSRLIHLFSLPLRASEASRTGFALDGVEALGRGFVGFFLPGGSVGQGVQDGREDLGGIAEIGEGEI